MAGPRRLEPALDARAEDRESQIDRLLVDGLDRYVAGQHEEAIHLWTRVLFLDRSHARARAYIDRARTALAERHRRAEQMLHETGESLAAGDAARARRLLGEAEATAGDDERAAGLRQYLERLERIQSGSPPAAHPPAVVDVVPLRRPEARRRFALVAVVVGLVLAGAIYALERAAWSTDTPPLLSRDAAAPPAVPSASDVALVRAQTLFANGRLSEALRSLDRVGADSPNRDAAEQLRVRIQRMLLAVAAAHAPAAPEATGR